MYEQYGQGDLLFMMLYGAAAMLSLTTCCYLLFRRANAIAPDIMLSYLVGAVLDLITLIPLAIIVLLAMLQDRRRPLWPACLMLSPVVIGMVLYQTSAQRSCPHCVLSNMLLCG